MKEYWRQYNFTEYEVSNMGNVRRMAVRNILGKIVTKPRPLKKYINKNGFWYVSLKIKGKFTIRMVHQMVANAFKANPLKAKKVNFKDGNKDNITLKNLEWFIAKPDRKKALNEIDKQNYKRGEDHCRCKFTDEDIEEILKSKLSPKEISDKFGISRAYYYRLKKKLSRRRYTESKHDCKKNIEKHFKKNDEKKF